MRSALVGVALLTACGGGSGVDIEIQVEDGVKFDAVELYIAYDHCKLGDGRDCPGVGWPGVTSGPVEGKVFELADKLRVRSDVLKDGDGVLHLEAAKGFENPVAVGVVALSGSAGQETVVGAWVIHDMHIPGGDEQKWQFNLKKTDAASTDLAAPTDDVNYRATVWARETAPAMADPNVALTEYAGCSAFQAWDGNAWTTEYFVPPDDTDCDGVPADCNPLWNHAPTIASKCISFDQEFVAPQPCTLGAMRCADESPGACTPFAPAQCIPELLCTACKDGDPKSCIRDKVNMMSPPGIPSFNCPFMIDAAASTKVGCEALTSGESLSFLVPDRLPVRRYERPRGGPPPVRQHLRGERGVRESREHEDHAARAGLQPDPMRDQPAMGTWHRGPECGPPAVRRDHDGDGAPDRVPGVGVVRAGRLHATADAVYGGRRPDLRQHGPRRLDDGVRPVES